ncbi:MAG TPA: hypothetical protein VHY08_09250 [Bacillota bacterium]|nr:hypothetical protein [Bacillota bacterium]
MKSTQDTWARLVREAKEIPESFTGFFQKLDTDQTLFPYTVFTPPDRCYRSRSNPKLICLFDDRIYVAEKLKKEIVGRCYLMNQIIYLEMGTMLLHSWFKICGIVNDQVASITVEYNTVVEHLFKPIIEKIRAAIYHLEKTDDLMERMKKETKKFDYLIKENYKYMNFGKKSLLPGTEVSQILLQPDIRVKYWKYFTRTISLVHQTILTDKELIIIKEGADSNHRVRYGGIWCYIPLYKITKLDVTRNLEEDVYKLSVNLPENIAMNTLFSADQKPQLDLLRSNFDQLKSRNI